MHDNILDRFAGPVATWFREVFADPTAVQRQAWASISAGENALVVSPTGSGKTLAAFLWSLNRLTVGEANGGASATAQPGEGLFKAGAGRGTGAERVGKLPPSGVSVLYISPLKALGVDVESNLRAPLAGIQRTAQRLGVAPPEITVAVRSGDTPQAERSRQMRRPPDILITTPESAYLMLTSKAAGTLRSVHTVIVDEIHALAGTKRGVHLALTLERLDRLVRNSGGELQRIGLSATVRPLDTVAQFLGGAQPVDIIAPPAEKRWDLTVAVPVEDMADLPVTEAAAELTNQEIGDSIVADSVFAPAAESGPAEMPQAPMESALPTAKSIWPFIEKDVYQHVMNARSTLVFVNSRRTAERLTSRLNELYALEHDPDSLAPALRRDPAQLMASSAIAGTAPAVIARAHHGSVSKDERATTEKMLKAGELRAVVATSSLELGIDMGAVEHVIQVESPPDVAAGLQRVGRAGHTVGAVSRGTFYPKHRGDLVQTAVTVQRMESGAIEELKVPRNALDVLTQHTVAAVAVEDWDVDEWYATVRRAFPYRDLPRDVFDAVINLTAGDYPSTDFSELRPRIVFDRITGQLSTRPGAQRVAVTNGGTIPDRGMFGVFLAAGDETSAPRRVGELDEEMVYESRVGDVFTLGASSWRIEDITRDQVIVSPAPGHTGRLPFWTGGQPGRPYELGQAVGAFRRTAHADPATLAEFPPNARSNLSAFLAEQADATGVVPDERTLVLERFTDELGDWRVVLHTPFGRGVNAAWALAVGARIAAQTGMDAQAVAGDDGIVLRLPLSDVEPAAELFSFAADEISQIVTEQVGNSPLFAGRFRECAARALLLPRRHPGRRAPLWQQRQRAAQLLDVARQYPSFPIILETVRECLQDVYDLPALEEVCRNIAQRRVRIVEVTTEQPSPFASSLLFTYTGAFMYEGDSPLAEKRATALSLDPALLAKLLGTVELRELLDAEIIADVDAEMRRVAPGRRARTPEELMDTLRIVGPVPLDSLAEYTDVALEDAKRELGARLMRVRIGGREHLAQAADAALLRDGLGIPVPPGVAATPDTIPDALEQLISRFARTRGPFVVRDVAAAFALGAGAVLTVLRGLLAAGKVVEGRYRQGVDETEYVAAPVLKIIRSRSLAQARAETAPVSGSALARFITEWQQVASVGKQPELQGVDGVFAALEQLAGVRLPASAWESLVLPQRVADYSPQDLDELTLAGEIHILGAGRAGARDPWIMLLPADYAAQLAPQPVEEAQLSALQNQVVDFLAAGGGYLFADIRAALEGAPTTEELREALWGLVELGRVAPESLQPVRARISGRSTAHRAARSRPRPQRSRLRMGRTGFGGVTGAPGGRAPVPPDMAGRWALAVAPTDDPTTRSVALGEAWLDRYGVVTRGSIVAEDVLGGFALAYKVLSRFEEAGKALRGYLVEGLGAAQFSTPAVIDRLRGFADSPDVGGWPSGTADPTTYVLAAADPANPYGAALPWPQQGLSRAAGAVVVLIDGLLAAHLTRGGKTLTVLDGLPEENPLPRIISALSALGAVTVEKINGEAALTSPLLEACRQAGARITPRGIVLGRPPQTAAPRRGRSMSEALRELGD